MASIACKRFVKAPPEVVFAAAADLRNPPRRIPAIVKLEVLTEGPVRAGTRFRETRRMFGHEATEEMEVQAFDPPRSYVVGCDSHGCRYRSEFRFNPRDDGMETEMDFAAQPLTFFTRLMSALMKPMMKKMIQECSKDLDALALSVERH